MRRWFMLTMPLLLLSTMLSGCVWWHDEDERGRYQERHDGYRYEEHHRHEHEGEYRNHDDDRYRDQGGYRYDRGYPGGGYPGSYPEERR